MSTTPPDVSFAAPGTDPDASEPGVRAPASFSQQRLWVLDRLLPTRSVYNNAHAFRLIGDLDAGALQRAWHELARRHDVLRTCFVLSDGKPVQQIQPTIELDWDERDLSAMPPAERDAEAYRRACEVAEAEFDLNRAPLFRIRLLRLAPREHWLLFSIHHIVTDGWSAAVLAREISALYAAFSRGEGSPLPELPVQYADFAAWQRQWMQGEVLEQQLAYWRRALADAPGLALPMDRPRPALPSYRGGRVTFELDEALTRALKELSRRETATLFMTLLAAFQVLLYRYTGQEDLVVGVPVAGRRRPELETLIGFFVNTLVLRGDLSGDPSFRGYLRRVRERALEAYAHQDVPFEKLVEELVPNRDPSRNPLFQAAFAFHNTAPAEWTLPGLEVQVVEAESAVSAKFDLTLSVRDVGGTLRARVEYASDLFDAETIERMMHHWTTLLEDAVAHPDRSVSQLRLMDEAGRQRAIGEWNDTRADYPAEQGVAALFAARARLTPSANAVVGVEPPLTYGALEARSRALARRLREEGVPPGARVGVCIERSAEEIIAFLGVLMAGCAYVPLDPAHPPERLASLLADADTAAVVTVDASLRALARARAGSARPVITIDDAETGESVEPPDAAPTRGGNDLAYVMYTSGSTGEPKGVAVPHRAIVRLVCGTDYVHLGAGNVIAHLANPAFDAATFEIWGALLNGARLALIPRKDVLSPRDLEIIDAMVTTMLTTALFNQVARDAPRAFTGREILFGGESADPRSVAAVLGQAKPRRLLHVYGPTETTTFATWHEVRGIEPEAMTVPIGRPIANTEVYLLDRQGEPVPPDVPGEIHIGGPGVALGYYGRADLTAERFVAHPFDRSPGARLFRTGDRARYRGDGSIEFLGRLDRQVKIRGHRIEPGEIEAVLAQLPQVSEAVVIVHGEKAETRRLIAYVVPAKGSRLAVSDLRRELRRVLPGYMLPGTILILTALPMTPNGKIDRAALPNPDDPAARRTDSHRAPRDPLQHMLAAIWEELLGARNIGIRESFFDLGGNSLLAAQMMDTVNQACGCSVPLTTLFSESTIEHLARALRDGVSSAQSPVVAIRTAGARPPLFFLHGDFSGGGFYCHALARELGSEQPFYAVHPHGLDGPEIPDSIEDMAADLLRAVRHARPNGPYFLGGHCNGALVAVEMARQLVAEGEEVPVVVVLDAKAPGPRRRDIADASAVANTLPSRRGPEQSPAEKTRSARDVFLRYRRAIAGYAPERYPGRIAVLAGTARATHDRIQLSAMSRRRKCTPFRRSSRRSRPSRRPGRGSKHALRRSRFLDAVIPTLLSCGPCLRRRTTVCLLASDRA